MFALNLNIWANIIPFIFMVAALYFIRNLIILIDGHTLNTPSYNASMSIAKF